MLRPILFKILSTTQLKVGFNAELSASIGIDNFKIEGISGSNSDVEIISVQIEEKTAIINTRPHHAKLYYVLKLQDSPSAEFKSKNGVSLVNDDLTRDIYFIGIEKVNSIRDDIFYKTPGIYNLEDTVVGSIIGEQADRLLDAQHAIGSVLNDNYISQVVIDELRLRGPGASDRLSNENAYAVDRVSLLPSGSSVLRKTIEIDKTDIYPVCLRQEYIESFSVSSGTENSSFNGFALSLPEKNIIKLAYAKLIRKNDSFDCNGNIGTEYNIEKYKYSILNNRFDQKNSFSNSSLTSNQILFSDLGNWSRPEVGDTIIVSYYFDNSSISILNDTIEVYEVSNALNESVPSNSKMFSLKHGNIIDDSDFTPDLNGIVFKESENSTLVPYQFSKELIWNSASLPKNTGEYTVNYLTGDVYVVGSSVGEGTGYNYFFADYKYKNIYKKDLDYSLFNNELNLNYLRSVFGKSIKISFEYEVVFAEGVDYLSSAHKEILGEDVQNRVTSSFSLKTKNGPITDVFRIYNSTTGEVYNLNYFYENDVYFTGNKLPSAKEVFGEFSDFKKVSGEELYASGYFITPILYSSITSNSSYLNIEINPGLPAELIDQLTTDYVVRFLDQDIEDYKIEAFYSPDSNGLIKGFSLAASATLPSIGSRIQIGTNAFVFSLKNQNIMNSTSDGVGSAVNSSLSFNSNLFNSEKFFTPINNNSSLSQSAAGSQYYIITEDQSDVLNKNLSKLRKYGDYAVDYKNGNIYTSVNFTSSQFGDVVSYITGSIDAKNENIISVNKVYKQITSDKNLIVEEYSSVLFNENEIFINSLDSTTSLYDGTDFINNSGEISESLIVNEFYEILTEKYISSIRFIGLLKDINGLSLDSTIESERYAESDGKTLLSSVKSGGKNLYIPEYISNKENIIDLKASSTSKIQNIGTYFEIRFRSPDIDSIYEIINSGNTVFLDSSLNFSPITDLALTSIVNYSSSEFKLFFNEIDSRYNFNYGFDYISNGIDLWKINGFSSTGYFIINKISEIYLTEFSSSEDIVSVVIRPNITVGEYTTVQYPINGFIISGDILSLKYITIYTPSPGTAIAIDYSSGNIFTDYIFIQDKISIYYEYGDNEIDWSINNSIKEGQNYYVSYKYGALRNALRKNFGSLTKIPFFTNQSLNTDRELYRDALLGVLSSFPKGPTIPAMNGVISSITKEVPSIKEMNFGTWILGRDYLNPEKVMYSGNLEFLDGRFGTGLKINEDNALWIPSVSNLPINEGTVEMWVSPDWHGINNDADLTFSFENIGESKFSYIGGDPFSSKNNYEVIGSYDFNDSRRGFDFSSGKLRIYKVSDDNDGYVQSDYTNLFGIYKKNLNLNRETIISDTIELSVNYAHLPRNSATFSGLLESGSYKAAGIITDNTHNMFVLDVGGYAVYDSESVKVFNVVSDDFDTIGDFSPPYPTSTCKCSFEGQVDILKNFDKLEIKITFDESLTKESIFKYGFWKDETVGSLMIVDQDGSFYQVVALSDYMDKKHYDLIPDLISAIYVKRYPLNYQEITGKSYIELNNIEISKFIILNKQIRLNLKESNKSSLFFNEKYIWNFDWSIKTKISYNIDPIGNLSYIGNGIIKSSFFYTDLNESDLFIQIGDDASSSSVAIGCYGISSINLFKEIINVKYKYSVDDIWIGSSGSHPRTKSFTLNRLKSDIDVNGISHNIDSREGVYIGYDPTCLSPINSGVGQWLLKARFLKYINLPYDVKISGEDYSNLMEYVDSQSLISGSIKTSGAFSSITKGRRTIDNECSDTEDCSKHFRFLGNKLIDSDGWSLIQDSDSDTIDLEAGGREAESYSWRKIGEFDSQNSSGIYRLYNATSFDNLEEYYSSTIGLTVKNSCVKGNIEFTVSAKVTSIDSGAFLLSKDTSILNSGITIAEINGTDYNIGISLSKDIFENKLVSIIDFSNMSSIESFSFDWDDADFHKYNLLLDRENSIVTLYIDDIIFSQKDLFIFEKISEDCSSNTNGSFSIIAVDQRLVDSSEYLSTLSSPIIDFNLIESNSYYNPGISKLENSDIFIVSNNIATFELHPNSIDEDDMLIDGYVFKSDIDEIMITSDNERFLLDSGLSEGNSRISIFKDGKGFLNFRVIDNSNDKIIHNIATNIKNFVPGEKHHIAASWKLNTSYKKDEMHLFIDGLEVPSLFRFGGYAPIKFNSKFSDISKENLWNYIEKKIVFPDPINDGVITAGSNVITSSTISTSSEIIGRSILFSEESELYGKSVIVIDFGSNWIAVGDPITSEPYIFQVSDSSLSFHFAPYCESVITDIKNEKFSINRVDCLKNEYELGGLRYTIVNDSVLISDIPNNYQYRYNGSNNFIEFIKIDEACNYTESILKTDIDIHVRTYGLTSKRIKDIISLSGTSLFLDEGFDPSGVPNSKDGYSILMTTGSRPKNISDVSIRKIILNKYSILPETITESLGIYTSSFEIDLAGMMTSSESVNVSKINDGRYLEILVDSDNIKFSEYNEVTIFGNTPTGYSSETLQINKNGSVFTTERYLNLDKITGSFEIIDPDLEFVSLISIVEKNSIFIQDGSGDYASIYRFSNGYFMLSKYGSIGYEPFELTPGNYEIDYSSSLCIDVSNFGQNMYIGTDITKSKPLLGTIDEFQILSTMLSDVRPWEVSPSGTRTITEDFYKENESCITNSTLVLIDFKDPISKQSRRLRNKKFLNSENNYTYTLSLKDREKLLENINNELEFVRYMMYLGYSKETAEDTFYECNKAEDGPIYNLATYNPIYGGYFISPSSVNSSFGESGYFDGRNSLIIDNDNSTLRNSSGTIEFWYQPKLDTFNDSEKRMMFEASSFITSSFKSIAPNKIILPSPASKILSIRLLSENKLSDTKYYSSKSGIIFDEISVVESTGRYSDGTGVMKDFSNGSILSTDGKEIILADSLPSATTDVVITYIPKQYSGQKISIYKDKFSRIILRIDIESNSYLIPADIMWQEDTWHRICVSYNFSSEVKHLKLFVDGKIYSDVYKYAITDEPELFNTSNVIQKLNITLSEQFSKISVGNNLERSLTALGNIDNIRISRNIRNYPKDSSGEEYDLNYSSNIDMISPVSEDDLTTYLQNFNFNNDNTDTMFAIVQDPKYGIFDFEVLVSDNFDRVVDVNGGEIEDLIFDIVNRIKPAHSNAYVRFIEKKCKE